MTVSVQVVQVNAAWAKNALKAQANVRPLNRRHVEDLKKEMLTGRFALNGETIKFDAAGRLFDGQHRLTAVAETGAVVFMTVATGVTDTRGVDEGRRRGFADLMAGMQAVNATTKAATVRLLYSLMADKDPWVGREDLHNDVLLSFYENNIDKTRLHEAVSMARVDPQRFIVTTEAAFYYLANPHAPATKEFSSGLKTGANLPAGNAILACIAYSDRLRRDKMSSGGGKTLRRAQFVVLGRAWARWRAGLETTMLWAKVHDAQLPHIEPAPEVKS